MTVGIDADEERAASFLAMLADRNPRGKLWRSILRDHDCIVANRNDKGRFIELCLVCGHESGGAPPSDEYPEVDAEDIRRRWKALWLASADHSADHSDDPDDPHAHMSGGGQRQEPPSVLPSLAPPWPYDSEELRKAVRRSAKSRNGVTLAVWRKFHEAATAADNKYWQEMRRRVFERDKHTCQGCLDPNAEGLNCHHLTYRNLGTELAYQLITLCDDCHDKVHFRGSYKKRAPKCYDPTRLPKWSY